MTKQIDLSKYTEFVNAVTSEESKYGGHFQDRLRDLYSKEFSTHRALTAALGLCAESGEFTEIIKKIVFQGKPVNKENLFHLKRELGDIMWYAAQASMALGQRLDDVIYVNTLKLAKRYSGGEFNVSDSENRAPDDI